MDCKDAISRLPGLVDIEPGDGDFADLEAHVAQCADCRRELGVIRAAWDALGDDPGVEVSPQFARKIRRRAYMPRRIRQFVAAAAVFVIVSGALFQTIFPTVTPTTYTDVEVIADLDVLTAGFDVLEDMFAQETDEPDNS